MLWVILVLIWIAFCFPFADIALLRRMIMGEGPVRHTEAASSNANFSKICTWGAAICLLVGVGLSIRSAWFLSNASKTTGKVVQIRRAFGSKGYAPVFEYEDEAGRHHTAESRAFRKLSTYIAGSALPVVYQTADPANAKPDTFTEHWSSALQLGVLGGGLMVFVRVKDRIERWKRS